MHIYGYEEYIFSKGQTMQGALKYEQEKEEKGSGSKVQSAG